MPGELSQGWPEGVVGLSGSQELCWHQALATVRSDGHVSHRPSQGPVIPMW